VGANSEHEKYHAGDDVKNVRTVCEMAIILTSIVALTMLAALLIGRFLDTSICSYEANFAVAPLVTMDGSYNEAGAFNAYSPVIPFNVTLNHVNIQVPANGHVYGQIYCRDLDLALRLYGDQIVKVVR